jgi:phosphoglycolate phosphatase
MAAGRLSNRVMLARSTPRIKAILFDKDGTLLDYHATWAPVNEVAAGFAARGDADLKQRLLTLGGLDPATGLYRAGSLLAAANAREIAAAWVAAGSPHPASDLTTALDRIFTDGVGNAVPVLPLASYFKRLKALGYKLGIASSDSAEAIHATALHFDFASWLDFYAGYDSGYGHKPGPGMVLAFAKAIDCGVDAIAVVGDNLHDMHMGRSAGCGLKVGVLTGTSDRATLLSAADLVLDSIADLEAVLARSAA